jgi:hypothetical protein
MSALSIQPSYPIFTDSNGQPLESGYVWVGVANLDPQANPIPVFFDAALTIPAQQPVRTLGGYPSRNGTPARLYAGTNYSIRVMNKRGSVVYSTPGATERFGGLVDASSIDYNPPFPGVTVVNYTVADKLSQIISVKDFGAVGDGVTDDTQAFINADAVAPAGMPIYVPAGTYLLASDVNAPWRQFLFQGASTSGGSLVGALVQRIDPVTGAWSYGVGESLQYGSYYRFGRNAGGPIGLTVGGGDPEDGVDGNVFFPDVYAGWTTVMPSKYLSASEFAVQPASSAGACTTSIGGNTVTRVSGGGFLGEFVGRRIYIGEGRYLVATVNVGAQTLTVTNLNGSAVAFASAGPLTFIVVGAGGSGVCNTSGTTVTRVSGDPFVPLTNTEYIFKIGGVQYTVSSVTDFNTIVLSASAGTQTNAAYEFWTSVDDLSSAIRVHRLSGAGFEENITIGAYAAGYFHIQAAGGVGRQYPLYIGTGYDTGGGKRKQIALQGNGRLNLGGDAGFCSLEIDGRDGTASNSFSMGGAAIGGGTPGLTVIGADTNIGMSVSTKGGGVLKFFSENYGVQQFEIGQLNTGTSWLGVRSDAFDQPRLYAQGAAANIDIQLVPKGTGRVLLGSWTANADASINGYITVKDSAGNLRKLATIA